MENKNLQSQNNFCNSENPQNDFFGKQYLTYLETCKELSVSLPTLKSYIGKGILPAYRLKGTARKYIKSSDFENSFEIIPIPKRKQTYEELETSFRRAIQRGKEIKKLQDEYFAITSSPSISGFCKWLYEFKRFKLIYFFKGAIQFEIFNSTNFKINVS